MKRKGVDGVGDYDDAFSPVPAASGFRTILSLATQLDMYTDHVISRTRNLKTLGDNSTFTSRSSYR